MPSGTRADPFELRVGAIDRFYAIFGGTNNFLDTGDAISTATWSCPSAGVTTASDLVNSTPLTLGGVEYAANEVASTQVSGITLNDLVEIVCTVVTTAGRTDKQSLWIRGVDNYSL